MTKSLLGSKMLFNSPLEAGVRSVVILDACYPRALDLNQMTWMDHLVVHTRDIGGPDSLHPDIPQRNGELLVRRRLVDEGLKLMRKRHMITVVNDVSGVNYKASEESASFVQLIRTPYGTALKNRASWLADFLQNHADTEIEAIIRDKIGRWAIEFQSEQESGSVPQ